MPDVQESLAGRISKIPLHPITEGEIVGAAPYFLEGCFSRQFKDGDKIYTRDNILESAMRGGFHETLNLTRRSRAGWHRDYIAAILERDLLDIVRIRQHETMKKPVKVLAAWSGKFINIDKLGASLSIQRPTLESYINALEAMFIIARVQAWTKTDYARVGKRKKLFMCDSGLMSSILGYREEQIRFNSDQAGKLVETFAYNELISQVDLGRGEYSLYHYRDREQREVDFIVERDDGALLGIEIKAAATAKAHDFKHLKWLQAKTPANRPFTGIVLYAGEHVGSFGNNLWAVPFSSMWKIQYNNA